MILWRGKPQRVVVPLATHQGEEPGPNRQILLLLLGIMRPLGVVTFA